MKSISNKISLLLILNLASVSLSAQKNLIGLEVGYGKTIIEDYRKLLVSPFNKELSDFVRIGFNYYYTPPKAIFSLNTGLIYDYKRQAGSNLNYLRIPISLDFKIGHTIQFIFGSGFYLSYLFAESGINNSDFYDSLNRFQIGVQGIIGFGYCISSDLKLTLVYQNNFDITTLYENQRTSPGGADYSLYEKGYDGFIKLGMKYNLEHE